MSDLSPYSSKHNKAVITSLAELSIFDNVEEKAICLTEMEMGLLKKLIETAYWSSRWGKDDDMDFVQSWVARLDEKLSGFEDCEGSPVFDCDDVAACILSSDAVSLSLLNWHTETGAGGVGNPINALPDAALNANLLPDEFVCDNDHLYGMCVGIIEYINTVTVEVFQAIEVATNPIELSAEIIDNVPLAGAAASVLDVVAWIQNTAYEAYNLYWSQPVKDNLACELYCLVKEADGCEISFEMLWEMYTDIPDVSPPSPLASWVVWFAFWANLALEYTATNNVKVMSLLALSVIRWGGKFGGMILGIRSFPVTMQLLADDENPDWEALCTECPEPPTEWEHVWNFQTHGMEAWTILDHSVPPYTTGVYVPDVGVMCTHTVIGNGWHNMDVDELFLDESVPRLTGMRFGISILRGTWDQNSVYVNFRPWGRSAYKIYQGSCTDGQHNYYHDFGDAETANKISFMLRVADYEPNGQKPNGEGTIVWVSLSGTGSDPFEGRDTGEKGFL